MDSLDTLSALISNLGFPIFVAVFMLMSFQKEMRTLDETVCALKKNITLLNEKIDNLEERIEKITDKLLNSK
jgi:prefoldin subunit 5